MTYEQKKEIVDRLKKNDRGYFALSLEERTVVSEVRDRGFLQILRDGDWCDTENIGQAESIHRIHPQYQLPDPKIEPPEGYRIVSMEDRKRCKYPEDCEVMWSNSDDIWWESLGCTYWDDDRFTFAVPSDYIFAEDRKKKGEWKRFGIRPSTAKTYWMAETPYGEVNLSNISDYCGFGGVAFADGTDYFVPRLCHWDGYDKSIDPVAVRFWVEG